MKKKNKKKIIFFENKNKKIYKNWINPWIQKWSEPNLILLYVFLLLYNDNLQFDFSILYVIPENCEKKILSMSASLFLLLKSKLQVDIFFLNWNVSKSFNNL
jgi:hypothetical protein